MGQAAVFRGPTLLVAAELVYVFADPVARVSQPVPAALRQIFDDYEAGRAMVQVRVGGWQHLAADAQALRSEVFVAEQQVPQTLERDGADGACLHAVAYNGLGMAVATGRLMAHAPGVARIGRMAVLRPLRGQRIGDAVLAALVDAARERGEREVVLHAQLSAVPFYRRAGFEVCGPVFEEAGIAHIDMSRRLG